MKFYFCSPGYVWDHYKMLLNGQPFPLVAHCLMTKMNWVLLSGHLWTENWDEDNGWSLGHCLAANKHTYIKQKARDLSSKICSTPILQWWNNFLIICHYMYYKECLFRLSVVLLPRWLIISLAWRLFFHWGSLLWV